MTYQEREKFKNWLLDWHLVEETIDGIMAEHDRLTTLNEQLLETLKAIETDEEGYCFWCNGYTKINGEVDHLSSCQLQAAIRAAESTPPPPGDVQDGG